MAGYTEVRVTAYDTLRFNWGVDSQNYETNTSFVKWTLFLVAAGAGTIYSSVSKNWSVTVDGTTYSGTNTVGIQGNEVKVLASGATTIWHNADGTKTFSYSFSQDFDITFDGVSIGTVNGSGTGTLGSIPRGATLLTAPSFTDLDNPTITYTNPAGDFKGSLQACISWTGADDIAYRDVSKTGTSYTFNFTDAERAKLRAAITSGTTRSVKFYVTTIIGDYRKESTLTRTFTLSNPYPTITSFEAVDANDATAGLTGNDRVWVRGYSNIGFNLTAEGKHGATIVEYEVSNGSDFVNSSSGTIKANSDTITATVTDSRGNSTSASIKAAGFVDYTPISCGLRDVSFYVVDTKGNIEFTIAGNFFSGSFGAVNNGISVYYRYKPEGGSYSDWIQANAETTSNGYSCASEVIEQLDYTQNYYIQAKAADSLVGVTSIEYKVAKVTPVFDWGENDFNFNVPIKINNVPMSDFVIDQGFDDATGWYYREWNSGIAEFWMTYSGVVNASQNNYNGYYYSGTISVPYPFAFSNNPCLQVSGGSSANMNFARAFGQYKDVASFVICGHASDATNTLVLVNLYAIGKWK